MPVMTRGVPDAPRRADDLPTASLTQRISASILVVAPLVALVIAVVTLWGHGISALVGQDTIHEPTVDPTVVPGQPLGDFSARERRSAGQRL